ncbi:MAG: hypothetical protein IK081_03165 [Lachnospiraceae bacterium]|nr:hypothetical protein [Lachnospiraceae bacterium]
MATGLHHISLIASSDKTIDFYLELGFRETKRRKRLDTTEVTLEGYGLVLEFLVERFRPKRDCIPEPLGIRYFSIVVDDYESIVRNNFDAHRMRDMSGERYCYLWDPDGQKIEVREDMEAKNARNAALV